MPPAAQQTRRDYPPGQLIPGTVYKVLRHIATGGMGTVYDVEDTTVGRRYVLKTLHPELGDRQDLTRRMIKEARALAQLHHTNIVEVYTAGMTADQLRLPFYVMERLDGQSLRTVLEKRKSLELQHAYEIAIDLLDALDCAHDKQIIHRDVKPDNIFLHRMRNGATVTKLLDFGIMRVMAAKGETAGRFLGTLRYAAPEQLRGDNVGPHTDIYSAGLVLYEMIAGRGPFDEERDVHTIGKAHLTRAAPPLSSFARVPVPVALEELVASALAKDPSARPRDAFSVAKDLRELAKSLRAPAYVSASTTSRPTAINVLAPLESRPNMGGPPSSTDPDPTPGTAQVASTELAEGRTVTGMPRPTLRGATLENAPPTGVSVSSTLASPGAEPAPPPGIDRHAATGTFVYDNNTPGKPSNGTEAMTPPIAVTSSADPFGMTQRALEAPPPVPPEGMESDLGALLSEPPPIPTQGSWQSDNVPNSLRRYEVVAPSGRAKYIFALAGLATVLMGIAVASILFIAQRVKPGPSTGSTAAQESALEARGEATITGASGTAVTPTPGQIAAAQAGVLGTGVAAANGVPVVNPSAVASGTPHPSGAPAANVNASSPAVPTSTATFAPRRKSAAPRRDPSPASPPPAAPPGTATLPSKLPGSGL